MKNVERHVKEVKSHFLNKRRLLDNKRLFNPITFPTPDRKITAKACNNFVLKNKRIGLLRSKKYKSCHN